MYIARVPNRGSPPAILLRESYREAGQVKTRTVANLSKVPAEVVALMGRALKGEKLVSADEVFEVVEDGSLAHGHVEAVLSAMRRLGFSGLIASQPSRERDLVVAMVAARVLQPQSKLATTLWWSDTTLPGILSVDDADEDDLYAAMDWVLGHQRHIEKKLAARHLESDGLALYDLTSSYFEGVTCPLATFGHDRDGKKGKLQVNYGLLTNRQGIPVSVSVFKGNTGDPKTLLPQVEKVQKGFGIERFVLVGDRGMLTQKQISALRDMEGIDWIGALRPEAIRKLIADGAIQMGLFDERNLFELEHADFPHERLVACRNGELAKRRAQKRKSLLAATAKELDKVSRMARSGRLHGKHAIEGRVRSILKKYRIGRYYKFEIRDEGFDYEVDEAALVAAVTAQAKGDRERIDTQLARHRGHSASIAKQLDQVRASIGRGRLCGQDEVGVRVGKVVNKYKVGKHFVLDIREDGFDYEIDEGKVAAEAALDGIYVVRTSLPPTRMDAAQTVRSYKLLSRVERAFRSFKSVDLMVRPIRHRRENRVRAHVFLCMLAYYVQWHMVEAWRSLLYADEDQAAQSSRDPVAPAKRSDAALEKVHTKRLEDGSRARSFRGLLTHLAAIVRNTCRCVGAGPEAPTFAMDTRPNPKQQKALNLLQNIRV
ncbi:transposase [Candidatus Bipolaricaulota bacterium]|nr:transposase [Candidatus Bipolaricaulota bacterium]